MGNPNKKRKRMRDSQHGFVDDERANPTLAHFFADARAHNGLISAMCKSRRLVMRTGGTLRDLKRSPKDTPLLPFAETPMRQALKDK
jgi:hypothetical protein